MRQPAATDDINTPVFFARLEHGDREAVSALYVRYAGEMMDYLQKTRRRHGLSEDLWRDVVQDVFLKFLKHPPELNPALQVGSLLMKMALNKALDRAKSERRRAKHEAKAKIQQFRAAAGAESVGRRLSDSENRFLIETKVNQLSPTDQQAIAAYVRNGPDRHAISLAAAIGVSAATAQMRFQRAKIRLAKSLDEEHERKDSR
ncbi:MAG: RNA polymerase sigma factor [Phycisphaerales bacterium]